LVSDSRDSLHLLERINIDLLVQNSIVPKAFNLARFKVSGKLPALQVNLSDAKYKSLIRLIDVCIPKFDDGAAEPSLVQPVPARRVSAGFNLPPLFPQADVEYDVDDDDDDDDDAAGAAVDRPRADEFFEVEDGSTNVRLNIPPK
jgi:vacuolar protein sorting-associated protein 13A/C